MDIEYLRQQLQIAANAIENCQNELPPPALIVNPGDNIQDIINAAEPGSILDFIPGQKYITGSLILANKPITLRCHGDIPNRRINPSDNLPILASGGPFSIIDGRDATSLVISGLSFEARADGAGEIIVLENARDIMLDRILIVGGTNGQKRGIRGNGERITLQHSHISNIWAFQQDSQAFCAWNGAGPYVLLDNFLEAAGENVMFGGADSVDEAHIPSHILIQDCLFDKNLTWKLTPNKYSVKNLLELKSARYVTIHSCHFDHNWTDAQAGFGIVLKSANQDGHAPWSVTEHVVFEDCILTNSANGINVQGIGTENVGGRTNDILFKNCRIDTPGIGIQIGGNTGEVTFGFCTFHNGYTFMSLYSDPKAVLKLRMENTLGNHNQYGVKGEATGVGQPSLDKFAGELIWKNNVLLGNLENKPYPPTTWFRMEDIPAGIKVGATV